jgi:hypothetical protein
MRSFHLFSLVVLLFIYDTQALSCSSDPSLRRLVEDQEFALSNGHVCVEGSAGIITRLAADHEGKGAYGNNIIKGGIHIVNEHTNGLTCSSSDREATGDVTIVVDDTNVGVLTMNGIKDCRNVVQESWSFNMPPTGQGLTMTRKGSSVGDATGATRSVRRQWELSPSSITAFYGAQGHRSASVVQMKSAAPEASHHASQHPLQRVYALGGTGEETGQAGNLAIDLLFVDAEAETTTTVLLSSGSGLAGYFAGVQEVLLSGVPFDMNQFLDHWTSGWDKTGAAEVPSDRIEWSSVVSIFGNDLDYPVGMVGAVDGGATSNLPADDLHAFLTGVYGSPAGCLCTHINAVAEGVAVGQIATTIAQPSRGYEGTYNYYDPDNYINNAALLWSGDRFLQEQVRMLVERSGSFLGGEGAMDPGQLPHHFAGIEPVFTALSGEVQTGPNVFWILTALNYAKSARNYSWLRGYMPTLRKASEFLFRMLQDVSPDGSDNMNLVLANVPGSLMVDVFLRNNFTTDSNAMLVGFFREFADAEEFVGNSTGASDLRKLSDGISKAMNLYLWCDAGHNNTCSDGSPMDSSASSGDHYVTQWDGPTEKTYRDFVDYDANLIAVANGIPTDDEDGLSSDGGRRAKRVLGRIDGLFGTGGQCRPSSTFVSERYYGPSDCTDGNTGDSWCAMGRIGWFDAMSRRAIGDIDGFENYLLNPLKAELISSTWMHERLNCDGTQMVNRTSMYFEYPSVTAMLIHNIRYGVELGFGSLSVRPFGPRSFAYSVNGLEIAFNPDRVHLDMDFDYSDLASTTTAKGVTAVEEEVDEWEMFGADRSGAVKVSLSPLLPNTQFTIMTSDKRKWKVTSSDTGLLEFEAPATEKGRRLTVECVAV